MKRVTIKDIASELSVSVGTVSKVLSGKPGTSDEMRASVYQKAKDLGYSVNRVAQSLARKPIRLGIVYPSVWPAYYGEIIRGMKDALDALRDRNVVGEFVPFSGLYSAGEIDDVINRLIAENVDMVVLCPASVTNIDESMNKLGEANIPLILVGSEIDSIEHLSCVRVNAIMAGNIAAEYMNYITPPAADVVILIGDKDLKEHKEKVAAFSAGLEDGRRLQGVFETQDEPEVAALLTKKIVRDYPNVHGIFVATGNSIATCNVLSELDTSNRIRVIATDLSDGILPFVESRLIRGVIYQNPVKQGSMAIQLCYSILAERTQTEHSVLVDPTLLIRSNII